MVGSKSECLYLVADFTWATLSHFDNNRYSADCFQMHEFFESIVFYDYE